MTEKATCSADGCKRPVYARNHCEPHYRQLRRTGRVRDRTAPRSCLVDGCGRPVDGRGLCHGHLQRLLRTGEIRPEQPLGRRRNTICTVDGCARPAVKRTFCETHYSRWRVSGDVFPGVPVRPRRGSGSRLHQGYRWLRPAAPDDVRLAGGQAEIAEHRLVMARALDRPLRVDESVHHRNGDRLDNRLENLELWSRWQPRGQRSTDKVVFAVEILARYRPDLLAD